MTILQALKKIKHLDRKAEKNRKRIERWCSYFGDEQPMYDTGGVRKLIQATDDLVNERNRLRHALHKTNIMTRTEFKGIEQSLDQLIILRTLTYPAKLATLAKLRRKEKRYHHDKDVQVVMQYDPALRDKTIDNIEQAMDELDEVLDHMNITTELVE